MNLRLLVALAAVLIFPATAPALAHGGQAALVAPVQGERWSAAQANAWYSRQAWLTGANYIPAAAINQLEMWNAATFDTQHIDR